MADLFVKGVIGLAYGQLALSAYFLALSCRHAVMPPYVAKELQRRRL
ncbi:MAG: hypothetical protein ACYDDU_06590 [Dermatophilaceae bacterium]